MLEKVKSLLLYAGFSKEEYRAVLPTIQNTNRILTVSVSALATVLIFAMYLSSSSVEGVKSNQPVYLIGLVVSSALFLTSLLFSKRYPVLITPLMMVAYSIFYIYGILIGTITSPNDKTVTFIVMLVYLPTLFIDRPLHMIMVTVLYDVIFLVLCFHTKVGSVLDNDVMDALAFGAIGVISGVIINHMKVRGYVREKELEKTNEELARVNQKLKHLNRVDALTGMQNRAAYEVDLVSMAAIAKEALGCIYMDADGLKKVNDELGHQAGDELLKFVASKIVEHFGCELTYRIGGDEFVIFVADPGEYEISRRTGEMLGEIETAGYHASVGWKIHQLNKLSMQTLEREAEAWMYQKKAEFHKEHPEFDRRIS